MKVHDSPPGTVAPLNQSAIAKTVPWQLKGGVVTLSPDPPCRHRGRRSSVHLPQEGNLLIVF
jgi:hypothetical protein